MGDLTETTGPQGEWMLGESQRIRENGGDSWRIPLPLAAKFIQKAKCENVNIRCDASDVAFVRPNAGTYNYYLETPTLGIKKMVECFEQKCFPKGDAVQVDYGGIRFSTIAEVTVIVGVFTAVVVALGRRTAHF